MRKAILTGDTVKAGCPAFGTDEATNGIIYVPCGTPGTVLDTWIEKARVLVQWELDGRKLWMPSNEVILSETT